MKGRRPREKGRKVRTRKRVDRHSFRVKRKKATGRERHAMEHLGEMASWGEGGKKGKRGLPKPWQVRTCEGKKKDLKKNEGKRRPTWRRGTFYKGAAGGERNDMKSDGKKQKQEVNLSGDHGPTLKNKQERIVFLTAGEYREEKKSEKMERRGRNSTG